MPHRIVVDVQTGEVTYVEYTEEEQVPVTEEPTE